MPQNLRPTDVPSRQPVQIATREDGGLVVRGPKGLSLLHGVGRSDLDRVLELIDGERNIGKICAALEDEYASGDVLRLLSKLAGDVLLIAQPLDQAETPRDLAHATPDHEIDLQRLLILGEGYSARRLAQLLGATGPETLPETKAELEQRLGGSKLVICALEDTAYARLFDVQAACLDAAVACLFVTCDPDGTRLGPTVVPGESPCFACAQASSLRALQLSGIPFLQAIADFRTGTVDPTAFEATARDVARETRAVLSPEPRSALSTTVILHSAVSGKTTYSVAPAADCPLCGSRRGAASHPLADATRRELQATYRRSPRLATDAGEGFHASVGVVGGGTAGYLTAMALRRKFPRLPVTLIESSTLPVIGVGEATTPLMPQFLHVDLGLDVHELFRRVQPTFKLGIRFEWGQPGGAFNYPFGPVHVLEPLTYGGHLEDCSPRSLLMKAGALPLHHSRDRHSPDWHSPDWHCDLGIDTAYHLDNQRFVGYLRHQARRFGVDTVDARIARVLVDDDGESVTGLVADDGRRFAFDLYIDCSGFRSLLLEQALGSPFRSYENSLLTDRALVATVPHGGVVAPFTLARTFDAGWCWSTPQRSADHRGYVFSSAFASPEQAEREMRSAYPEMGEARLIKFRAGRHEHFWRGNVVAMGNAYGFVEPLESTALHMLIRQIGLLLGALPVRPGERGVPALASLRVGAYWDYLAWFLALHYRFNHRLDSPFWRHCRRHVDVSRHGELIAAFRERGPLSYQPALHSSFSYPDPLWGAEGIDVLLLGQGVSSRLPRPLVDSRQWNRRVDLFRAEAQRSTPQARALTILDQEPDLLERWIAAFERVGPAFG